MITAITTIIIMTMGIRTKMSIPTSTVIHMPRIRGQGQLRHTHMSMNIPIAG